MRNVMLRLLALVAVVLLIGGAAPVQGQGAFAHGAVVALQGTPHLWFADEHGVLHWGGDTRALAGKHILWSNRVEVSLDQLRTLPVGDPWLTAGLLKDGDPIYLVKWESNWEQPQLLHIQSIGDVELFGINGSNYGNFVIDKNEWERRFGISAAGLQRDTLAAAIDDPLTGPPNTLGLDPFYEKYLDADGIPIVSSAKVPDDALFRAEEIIGQMLALRPDLRATIAGMGIRVAIMAASSVLSDLPEFEDIYETNPGTDWDKRTRGGGVGPTPRRPVVAIAEENLLCYGSDVFPYEDIFVHEFAHVVLTMGVEQKTGGDEFRRRLETAYETAFGGGLWRGTYAGENPDEYWAEGVQSWFGLNDPPGPIHNDINTRVELDAYDPVLASLIQEVFGDVTVLASCHETNVDIAHTASIRGVVLGPDGQPLEGVGLWAWQGERANSGYGTTGVDGTFDIRVPDGSFTLDIYTDINAGCTFVGWYGPGGFTTLSRNATRIHVDGASVAGIEIRLPEDPDDLPRIEWCA